MDSSFHFCVPLKLVSHVSIQYRPLIEIYESFYRQHCSLAKLWTDIRHLVWEHVRFCQRRAYMIYFVRRYDPMNVNCRENISQKCLIDRFNGFNEHTEYGHGWTRFECVFKSSINQSKNLEKTMPLITRHTSMVKFLRSTGRFACGFLSMIDIISCAQKKNIAIKNLYTLIKKHSINSHQYCLFWCLAE